MKPLRSELERWLSDLDPDELLSVGDNWIEALPKREWQFEDWHLTFIPIPKSRESRNKPGIRPIGIRFPEMKWINPMESIRDTLLSKARRYGNLDLSYIIAVNTLGEFVGKIDIMESLFGKEDFTFLPNSDEGRSEPVMRRQPNGLFIGQAGIRYTRVSAVLVCIGLSPWNLASSSLCLYLNPWAKTPVVSELSNLTRANPSDGKMHWSAGTSIREILHLPSDWPWESHD